MASISKLITNDKRKKLIAKDFKKRQALKKVISSQTASDEDKAEAMKKMATLPRNSSPIRYRNRCEVTGRPRGFLRKFRMSRIALRDFGLNGHIPGLVKSSW